MSIAQRLDAVLGHHARDTIRSMVRLEAEIEADTSARFTSDLETHRAAIADLTARLEREG